MATKVHAENSRLAPSSALLAGCLIVALVTHSNQSVVAAQALLYDNTDHLWSFPHNGPRNIKWVGLGSDAGDWFEAQPFKLGGHDNIASVSIPMGRDVNAHAEGTIHVSIWDDNGRGFPGKEVGALGELDIDTLERAADLAVPRREVEGTLSLPSVTFDSPIDDLVPGETYYVVIDYRGLDGIAFGDALVGLSNDPAGTNRAGGNLYSQGLAEPPFEDGDWVPATRYYGGFPFLQMSVTSADEPYKTFEFPVGTVYREDFALGDDGQATAFLPQGWASSDTARSRSFDGSDLLGPRLSEARSTFFEMPSLGLFETRFA